MAAQSSHVGDLKKLSQAFSAAAINPALWEAAMDAAAQVTGSAGSLLLPLRGHLPSVPASQSIGDMVETYFRDGWYSRDTRYHGVPVLMRNGVMSEEDFTAAVIPGPAQLYQECSRLTRGWSVAAATVQKA